MNVCQRRLLDPQDPAYSVSEARWPMGGCGLCGLGPCTDPDPRVEMLRRTLLHHHPMQRTKEGPITGCYCGQVQLGQDVIAHVAAQVVAALPPSPAEEAVKRVEGVGPHVYEALRRKGVSKQRAAKISNGKRRSGKKK